MQIAGSTAFITGGASGLGPLPHGTSHHLEPGWVCSIEMVNVVRRLRLKSVVSPPVRRVFCRIFRGGLRPLVEQLGAPRITIACAGVGAGKKVIGRNGPHPLDEFERIVNINLIGVFNIVRLAAWAMHDLEPVGADGERGVIVTTASIAATDGVDSGCRIRLKGGVLGHDVAACTRLSQHRGIRCFYFPDRSTRLSWRECQMNTPNRWRQQHRSLLDLVKGPEYAHLCAHIISNTMLNGSDMRIGGGMRMAPSRLSERW